MKKLITVIIIMLFVPASLYAACTGESPTWTCSADTSSSDLQSCINSATAGDTINVGAGSATWNSQISVTKGIKIIGAGIGSTIVTNEYSPSGFPNGSTMEEGDSLILIKPSAPSTDADDIIRLSGFTINFGATSYGILYVNNSTTDDSTVVRLDHLALISTSWVFQRYGLAHGVMDNCTITGGAMDIAGSSTLWTTNGYEYGTVSNFYFEDNVISASTTTTKFIQAGNGPARYAWRYNTITLPSGTGVQPLFDQHGNYPAASCFGAEIYGNTINVPNTSSNRFFDQRGGKSLVYNNKITKTASASFTTRAREEYADSEGPGLATNAINGQPQHVSSSYYFDNLLDGTEMPVAVGETVDGIPAADTDYWVRGASFDGSSGVGCGTLGNRPGTCTTGVGYWATDQSCSNLTDYVGASPTTPIAGTLYTCTATNTWTSYYTPYTYPHPLRSESDAVAPTATWAIDSTGLIATATFSETVNATTKTGVSFTGSVTGAITATYKDGMPGGIVRYDLNKEVQQRETVVVEYTTPGDGIKDVSSSANPLADISDGAVTNNSTQSTPPLVALTIGAHVGATVNVYPGINCGSTCSADYDNGSVLTLSVTTLPNYTGCTIGGTGCGASTTMSEARNCTVTCTKIAADNKVGTGTPGHKVGAGNPAHKMY